MADTSRRKHRENLEEQVEDMCWSWNAEDINPDEDNGKMWIPVMPRTMEEQEIQPRETPQMPPGRKVMTVYPVGRGPAGDAQARMPVRQAVEMLKRTGPVVILVNDESSEDRESTGVSEGELEAKKIGSRRVARKPMAGAGRAVKELMTRRGPKNCPAITLTTPRLIPCDQCRKVRRSCFSQKKGPEILVACAACFKVKMSCKTGDGGSTGQKEKVLGKTTRKDSTVGDVESEESKEDSGATGEGPVVEATCGQEGTRRCGRTTR